jgi:hypothetical protein
MWFKCGSGLGSSGEIFSLFGHRVTEATEVEIAELSPDETFHKLGSLKFLGGFICVGREENATVSFWSMFSTATVVDRH